MQKILLLEDDLNLNRGIALLLSREGYEVRQVYTIKEAKEAFQKGDYALVISDITLPDGTGLDFGRMVRAGGDTYLIYLTALDQEIDIVNGYDTGADDYITKPFSLMALVSKVNALMRRLSKVQAQIMSSGEITVHMKTMQVYKGDEPVTLSKKEFSLLLYLWENAGQIVSKESILEHVWDIDGQFVDDNTVTVNISRLKNKLGTVDFIRDRDDQKIERVVQMLEETYGYHSGSGSSDVVIRIIWGIGLLVGVIVCSLFLYLDRRKNWSRYGDEEQLQQLYECLQEFRKGKFQTYPEETSESEQWLKVWESVKELGQYFEDLKERLEQEENGTKSLITDISHQLKTPLASLRMSHELVAENRVTGEEQREFLEQESQELTKLEQLLNELVNLSRLETHMIQIHSLHESLKKTLTEAVSQIYMKARGKDISIQVEMDDDIVVNHDSKWTVEALTNILENAVKYSPEHTTITVRTQELASNVLIEVEDEGMGIPAEELHKIYQRFYRGRKAKEQVKDGAGVGLYLARKIIEEQGGTIAAKRKAEKGMIFKVTLPLIIGE